MPLLWDALALATVIVAAMAVGGLVLGVERL